MTQLEKDIERKLRTKIEALGGHCLKWVCPGWLGVPDRIVLLPGARIFFVETKRPRGGKLAPMQRWWQGRIRRLGFSCWVVWDEKDLAAFLAYIEN
jgi:hypothetical protein